MAVLPGMSHAQTAFIRAFRHSPTGPRPNDWPSPAILRRWLRKPTFRSAYQSLIALTRNQLSFQLLCASLQSVQDLHSDIRHRDTDSGRLSKSQRAICLDLLKLTRTHLPRAKAAPLNEDDQALGLAPPPLLPTATIEAQSISVECHPLLPSSEGPQ